jgi:hypothetical protein
VPTSETLGETNAIAEPLRIIVEVTSKLSINTFAEMKPYACGWMKAQECRPPSIDTIFGDNDSS